MYTYAFYQTLLTPLALPYGIAGLVEVVASAQLSAIVEPALTLEHLQQDDALLVQAALAHDRVVYGVSLQTTTLPLRFGTCFSSVQALLMHLETHQQAYMSQLARLEGKAEYPLKFMPVERTDAFIAPDVKGKDYFLAKKQQYQSQLSYQQQQQAAIEHIERTLIQTYPQSCCSEVAGVKTMYLLARRDREQQLCHEIQALQQRYPQWQLALGNALPPYHFVASAAEAVPSSTSQPL